MIRRDFEARSVCCENGETAALLYFILEEKQDSNPSYGVKIVMHRGRDRRSAAVHHITPSHGRIRELLALLSRNTVTPCTLRDTIEDELNKF